MVGDLPFDHNSSSDWRRSTVGRNGTVLYRVHVGQAVVSTTCELIRSRRWIMKIPDPLLGPQGVRGLLALRGVFGQVYKLFTV